MEKEYKLRMKLPRIILGAPLPETENPFLAIPFEEISINIVIRECGRAKLNLEGSGSLEHLINAFYQRLSEAVPGLCIDLHYEAPENESPAGLYAAVTSAISYSIARYNGEKLEPWEIVELSRYADPIDPPKGWHHVIDALRYSLATGKPAVYRNDEEFAVIETSARYPSPKVSKAIEVEAGRLISRDKTGGEVYNALVKLTGLLVLEGAVKLREQGLTPLISDLARIQNGIIYIGFGASPSGERCIVAPGLPGYLEESCW